MTPRRSSPAIALALALTAGPAAAQQAGVPAETQFVFNSFLFLMCGVLVMWMAAGFAMLEAGLVRSKNTATICLKNVALYSIAGLMFYLVGYNLMYTAVPEGGYIGSFALLYNAAAPELALINEAEGADAAAIVGAGTYASMADWFFQMVFVATAASIVSGTVAERIKLWPFLLFVLLLTGIIYPIQGAWSWGGGWLDAMGFSDFAGSTIVHSVGGWAALVGALLVGPRKGKYGAGGRVNAMPGANLPLATLGTFVLWMGWFGFNGGSQLALGTALDVSAIAIVFVNTNMAAAAGVVAAMLVAQFLYKKVDLTLALNGAIAGLVAITAGPDLQNHLIAMIVGAIGGVLCTLAIPLLDKLRIDDVVGAISAHLVAGIWGTLAVAIFGGGNLIAQVTGIVATGVYVVLFSGIAWVLIDRTLGLRVNEEEEALGLDRAECGLEAYPEFSLTTSRM